MRDLYEMFRDSLIDDAVNGAKDKIRTPWSFMPPEAPKRSGVRSDVGRMQTVALIRRFMNQATKEFPGGIVNKQGGIVVQQDLIDFIKTCREQDADHAKIVEGWRALKGVSDGR